MAFSVSKTGFFEGQKARGVKLPCLPLFDDLTVDPKSAYQDRIFQAIRGFQDSRKSKKKNEKNLFNGLTEAKIYGSL